MLTHIDRAFRPILIAQGLEDVRVTRAESEQMVTVLRERNVPVTYITFPDEGHGFLRRRTRPRSAPSPRRSWPNMGGAAELIDRARDFNGSTFTIEAGADLVPGLADACRVVARPRPAHCPPGRRAARLCCAGRKSR